MKYSLNRIVSASFAVYFLGVLGIGSVSVWHAQKMLDLTLEIAEESSEVRDIGEIQRQAAALVSSLQLKTVRDDPAAMKSAPELAGEIERNIGVYLSRGHTQNDPDIVEEVRLLHEVRDAMRRLGQIGSQGALAAESEMAPLVEHSRAIVAQLDDINELHFKMIGHAVSLVYDNLALIRNLYVIFALAGLTLIYIGYRLHARHVVVPVTKLRQVAEQVAEGDLTVRLKSDSHTEIGALYRAFNRMVAQLQDDKRQRDGFHRILEEKVLERTRALEQTHRSLEASQGQLLRMENMALVGQIATSVNHEVRTPLNTLSMNVQLIQRMLGNSAPATHPERRVGQKEILDRIAVVDREVARISAMLEEFVRYARLAPSELRDIDPNTPIRHVAEMVDERVRRAGASVRLKLAEPSPLVRADENQLVQVLLNLATNAINAMPEGGTLSLASALENGQVIITVADTGVGIDPANYAMVFQPFFTSKEDGMGFGLAIVKRIIENHGGQIDFQSQVGIGTVFTIRLPLAATVQEPT